jgi:TonB family protein
MAAAVRTATLALLVGMLAACGDSAPDAGSNGGAGTQQAAGAAQVPVEELLAQANAALQDRKLFDPPEGNAMALFLEVSQRAPAEDTGRRRRLMESVGSGDPQQQAQLAMIDLLPFGLVRVEEALRAGELEDAGRILRMLEKAQPDAGSVRRLRGMLNTEVAAARASFRSTDPNQLPQLLSKTLPTYPPRAERRGVEGWVHLTYAIKPDGSVDEVRVVDSEPPRVFDQEAMTALRQWRYAAPGREVRARERMEFTIDRD